MAQLLFDEAKHEYRLDGVLLPSVTQITRFAAYDSANGANAYLRDLAAVRGTLVHYYCQALDYDGEVEIAPEHRDCEGYVEGYRRFLRDYRVRGWDAIERPLASASLGYAGTLDRIGSVDGRLSIVDIKTSAKINKLACDAQLNGYAPLAFEAGYDIQSLHILQLLKKGDYRLYPFPVDRTPFEDCFRLHRRSESFKRRKKA